MLDPVYLDSYNKLNVHPSQRLISAEKQHDSFQTKKRIMSLVDIVRL